MNFSLVLVLALIFIAVWALVSYFLVRINQQTRADKQAKAVQPAFRLADQWIMESQRKIEQFIESAEAPLGTAQHELLELRLEAGRLPQGVKNLRTLRDSLAGHIRPLALNGPVAEIAGLYLAPPDMQVEEPHFVYLRTEMGLVPVLEAPKADNLTDGEMKDWLSRLSAHANPTIGGFLYFAGEGNYRSFEANKDWVDALRHHRLMALDFKGLTALLISLQVAHETDQLIRVFQAGVQSTVPLVGQSDQMGAALTSLSASALKAQILLDGGVPTPAKEMKE